MNPFAFSTLISRDSWTADLFSSVDLVGFFCGRVVLRLSDAGVLENGLENGRYEQLGEEGHDGAAGMG